VGKRAESAYTTALNHLLAKGSGQRLQVGDASTVFWAEKKHEIESVFADLFGEPPKGEPEQNYKQLVATFRAPVTGAPPQLDPKTRFFVLGLAPNAARVAVRFWYAGTVGEIVRNIQMYFGDIEVARPTYESNPLLPLNGLLAASGRKVKYDSNNPNQIRFRGNYYDVAPGLAGEIMKAILADLPFPSSFLAAAIRRCRAEREITYPRVALIKAVLVRDNRFGTRFCRRDEREVSMSLDPENTNIGYRLGRLFAVLEKIQEEANPRINATIRDRFYGSASATPVAAFPHLMKLKNHHLSKLDNRGRAVNLEKMIGGIIDGVRDFPAHLSLADQGRFAVGYYHQRQVLFASSKKGQ
jgi:CRISPR-associated protein Csd1